MGGVRPSRAALREAAAGGLILPLRRLDALLDRDQVQSYSNCNFSSRTILSVRNESKGHGHADFCKDMDMMWLRNPFPKLDRDDGEELGAQPRRG